MKIFFEATRFEVVFIWHYGAQNSVSDNLLASIISLRRHSFQRDGLEERPRLCIVRSDISLVEVEPVQQVLHLHLGKNKNARASVWRRRSRAK